MFTKLSHLARSSVSLLHRLLPVLKDPMIELQMVDIVQAADGLHFDVFVITLSKG